MKIEQNNQIPFLDVLLIGNAMLMYADAYATLRCTDVCRRLWYVERSCNFSFVTTNLHHDIFSLSSLIKLTREELANIVLDYQHKFDNSLGSINAEFLEVKAKFSKMESDLTIS